MTRTHPQDPLHGVTLQSLLEQLVARHGWAGLASRVDIRCFSHDPSIKSSLVFLRRNRWARDLVEQIFIEDETSRRELEGDQIGDVAQEGEADDKPGG